MKGKDSAGGTAATTESDGTGDSGDHLLEQSVQLDEHMEQQQQSQIPMGQVALLDFFEPSSRRLPRSLEHHS